ncbi:GerMN domain-containing protein [Paenibacillus sp. J2TS4]|uniref:GerMN domain-containing protein n=1 Tax=Paenibacillus sp. J2TS4 TaxID=2807194 RepID=UPI001B1F65ED|nr:GerMN domain-containing protein [Paenibacillus sp. J2TS4]GIP34347.1 hypothetical protein J2TS4_35570 [Paenibacillus sp. J2TS4]
MRERNTNKWMKLALATACAAVIATGCAQGGKTPEPGNAAPVPSQQPNNPEENNETNIAPKPNEDKEVVKKTVTLYFADKDLMEIFAVDREVEAEEEQNLPLAALESWISGPKNDKLGNLVPPGVLVEYVKDENGVAQVSFSKELKNANLGSGGEMFLLDQITLTMKQFGYDSTQILIEGEKDESLLGHVTTSEPLPAGDPSQYKKLEE